MLQYGQFIVIGERLRLFGRTLYIATVDVAGHLGIAWLIYRWQCTYSAVNYWQLLLHNLSHAALDVLVLLEIHFEVELSD